MVRIDGRELDELRPVKITRHYNKYAEGSALIEVGDTRVVCTASIDDKVPPFRKGSGKGWVTAEYGMIPRATEVRTVREAAKGRQGGRTLEIQRLIGRSLRAVVNLEALGERTLHIDCDVVQADGGTRTASITGAFVAVADACHKLEQAGVLSALPIRDFVGAVSVGIVDGEACLDLCYAEDSSAAVDMNIVMTGGGRYVELQGTGEQATFDRAEMDRLLELGRDGITRLVRYQRTVLGELGERIVAITTKGRHG